MYKIGNVRILFYNVYNQRFFNSITETVCMNTHCKEADLETSVKNFIKTSKDSICLGKQKEKVRLKLIVCNPNFNC